MYKTRLQHKCILDSILMDYKKVGIYIGLFIISFLLMMVASFFIYPVFNAEEAARIYEQINVVERLREEVDSYEEEDTLIIDPLTVLETSYEKKIDSLYVLMDEIRADYEEQLAAQQNIGLTQDLEDATRALLNLDERSIGPIVNMLEDDQLIKLYKAGSNIQRERLLEALDPEKASDILRQVIL